MTISLDNFSLSELERWAMAGTSRVVRLEIDNISAVGPNISCFAYDGSVQSGTRIASSADISAAITACIEKEEREALSRLKAKYED